MSAKRMYMAMWAVAILATFSVLFSLSLGIKYLKKQSDSLVAVKLENRVLDEKRVSLVSAQRSIQKYSQLDLIAQSVVPQDKDQANTVRSISKFANDLGIKLSGISFPPSTLGQSKKPGAKSNVTQVTPVTGLKGVYEMQVTVQQDTTTPITYEKFLKFLSKLESNRRTAQVSSITINPSQANRSLLSFNLVLSTYIRPTK